MQACTRTLWTKRLRIVWVQAARSRPRKRRWYYPWAKQISCSSDCFPFWAAPATARNAGGSTINMDADTCTLRQAPSAKVQTIVCLVSGQYFECLAASSSDCRAVSVSSVCCGEQQQLLDCNACRSMPRRRSQTSRWALCDIYVTESFVSLKRLPWTVWWISTRARAPALTPSPRPTLPARHTHSS